MNKLIDIQYKVHDFIQKSLHTDPGSRGDLESEFSQLALELFEVQYSSVMPYRLCCNALGKRPNNIQSWKDIPAVPSSSFKDMEFSSIPEAERSIVFLSSGTTAKQQSRHYHNNQSIQLYEMSVVTWFNKAVIQQYRFLDEPDYVFIFLTPAIMEAPNSSLVYMFDCLAKKFAQTENVFVGKISDQGWIIDFDKWLITTRSAIEASRRIFCFGTALSWVQLISWLERQNIKFSFHPQSLIFETGGYKGRIREIPKSELYKKISKFTALGLNRIISEYGMCELSSQAYDVHCNYTRGASVSSITDREFLFPPWARTVILDPETNSEVGYGDKGMIKVVDLANVWSVAAILTEDVGLKQNLGFKLIGRAGTQQKGCSLLVM